MKFIQFLNESTESYKKNTEVWIGGPRLAVKFHIFMDEIFDLL